MNKNIEHRFWTILIFLAITISAISQPLINENKETFGLFGAGDRVCFVGNSITNNGQFHHNLLLYYITRFPNKRVSFFNCGVAGDQAMNVIRRMEDDILVHQPTHAVIMLGMNDVNRMLYGPLPTQNADTLMQRQKMIETYKINLEDIVTQFLSKDIKVILQKPTIYDQTMVNQTKNCFGVNDALKTCSDFIGEMAVKYKLPTVDYWTIMNRLNNEMQKNDPTATITGNDRVHPDATGHFVMSYQFLKTSGAPQFVSKINISKKGKATGSNCLNCKINSIAYKKDTLYFNVTENALPFPITEDQTKGLELVPFTKDLNIELLQISDLKTGIYTLIIDGKQIENFTNLELKNGINLANYTTTPQYQQALKVREVLDEAWGIELELRGIKFIEGNKYYRDCPNKEDLDFVANYLDSVFTTNYPNPYFKLKLAEFNKNKPYETERIQKIEELKETAYELAKPKIHKYRVYTK